MRFRYARDAPENAGVLNTREAQPIGSEWRKRLRRVDTTASPHSPTRLRRRKTLRQITNKSYTANPPYWRGYFTPQWPLDHPFHPQIRRKNPIWNVLELLRRIINYGYKTNRCPALSFQIEMPNKDNEVVEYLRPEEAQRFLEVVRNWPDHDVSHMLQVAYFTGMRRGELFKLEVRDIDFHMNLIRIRDPKGGKTSSIGMSNLVAEVLRAQIELKSARHLDCPFVFPGRSGKQRTDCSAVDNIRKQAGLPVTFRPFHGLRHHFAVTLANSGKFTINMISEALTHKNVDFTKKKYAHFLPETLTAIGNAAADVLQFKS